MSPSDEVPDVDRLARSMLLLHGDHHDHDDASPRHGGSGTWSKSRDFADDPQRAAAIREASRADRDHYLTSGLKPVDCRFCHVTVAVRRLGPGHTAVQWNADASQRCAYFTEVRALGGNTARTKACPRLTDSIEHAVAEGYLEYPIGD
ncbi:hypothetical protein [Mycobacterium lacus]|uniref:Ferredoxin n=1 Tax=Mycobacterium lacus TaxID=169765 RepID=A0A1X1XSW3_9MYCO|nr:hypothetical protein [Mycobacterium lacus]MCV7125155.1 hypothetical protein [Mycobacterium lacus]ORW01926.1 hypothetical protein AWC15_07225 [Mycobacterium lacus]BBX94720.1 hypothetical protein MLAC_00140 [Mycobacterium lacus]BBX99492.1 hypothetical protein MLAC_47860 [Mycobacterium lacus]